MEIIQTVIEVLKSNQVVALVAMLGANLILALVAAIQQKVFNLSKLSDFIPKRVAPFLAYIVVAMLAEVVVDFVALAITVYIALAGLYVKGIISAIKSITGLSIPDSISEKLKE